MNDEDLDMVDMFVMALAPKLMLDPGFVASYMDFGTEVVDVAALTDGIYESAYVLYKARGRFREKALRGLLDD